MIKTKATPLSMALSVALANGWTAQAHTRDAEVGPHAGGMQRAFSAELVARQEEGTEPHLFDAKLTSTALVERYFGQERLIHTDDAVDLSRQGDMGFPLIVNHDFDRMIGRVRNVRLVDGALRGVVDFNRSHPEGEQWRRDVLAGYAGDMSAGYVIDVDRNTREAGSDVVDVNRWRPHEFSMVTVAADVSAGVGRLQARDLTDLGPTAADERRRATEIRTIFAPYLSRAPAIQALQNEMLDTDITPGAAGVRLLALIGAPGEPLASDASQGERGGFAYQGDGPGRVVAGRDQVELLVSGARDALMFRAGMMTPEARAAYNPGENPYQGYSLPEMARAFAQGQFPGERFESRGQMCGAMLTRAAPSHGVGDFPGILLSISTNALMRGFGDAPETWRAWCRVGSVPDYKQVARSGLSEFDDLPIVPEGADIPYGDLSDAVEYLTAVKYAKRFSHTREMIMNDDLDAFTRIPTKMGRAAARIPGDLAYAVLTGNPTLNQDATTVFHANHNNQVASSGGAPTVTTVSAARVAMAKQTDYSGNQVLGIQLAHLIVPLELEDQARVLAASEYDPNATAGVFAPNSQRGRFQVTADHRLSTDDAAKWYAACNPNAGDTVEIAFIDGREAPTIERENVFANDATDHKVRLEVGATALDFRGLYYQVGA